ncbi:MAG: class I SAM-dependent methyltransferase [Anaerolineae bacterium]|nr:class I SAM-dependent methyltransferase [Anaerolineae bacterium]
MENLDRIAAMNRQHWERMVREGCGFTLPSLDLDRVLIRRYAEGSLDHPPEPLIWMYPASILDGVEGKDVLCLASGGGQQSAVFGLQGARVTVVDLAEGQLQGDRVAAEHYGYPVTTIQADMRDLSCLSDESFDLVYQAPSVCYVPDLRPVFAEVTRVLRPGGVYRVCFTNPATEFVGMESWDGHGYRISLPYAQKEETSGGSAQFRHYLADIFNGLLAAGLSIEQVADDPQYFTEHRPPPDPGTWHHYLLYCGGFAVVSRKRPAGQA